MNMHVVREARTGSFTKIDPDIIAIRSHNTVKQSLGLFKKVYQTLPFLTVQFAKIIEVSYPTAMRMVERGEIKVIQVGGIKRIYTDEVNRFLNEGNATDKSAGDSPPQQPLS